MRRKGFVVAVLVLALGSYPAKATTLVDHGTYIVDTSTGLQWLDINQTYGRSYNNVVANLNNSADIVAGYQVASEDQFAQLLIDAGITPGCFDNHCELANLYNFLIMFGAYQGFVGGPNDINLQFYGFTTTPYNATNQYVAGAYYFYFPPRPPGAGASRRITPLSTTAISSDAGTLLVRTAVTPLPGALPLFASGLGALVLAGWRGRRRPPRVA